MGIRGRYGGGGGRYVLLRWGKKGIEEIGEVKEGCRVGVEEEEEGCG